MIASLSLTEQRDLLTLAPLRPHRGEKQTRKSKGALTLIHVFIVLNNHFLSLLGIPSLSMGLLSLVSALFHLHWWGSALPWDPALSLIETFHANDSVFENLF